MSYVYLRHCFKIIILKDNNTGIIYAEIGRHSNNFRLFLVKFYLPVSHIIYYYYYYVLYYVFGFCIYYSNNNIVRYYALHLILLHNNIVHTTLKLFCSRYRTMFSTWSNCIHYSYPIRRCYITCNLAVRIISDLSSDAS